MNGLRFCCSQAGRQLVLPSGQLHATLWTCQCPAWHVLLQYSELISYEYTDGDFGKEIQQRGDSVHKLIGLHSGSYRSWRTLNWTVVWPPLCDRGPTLALQDATGTQKEFRKTVRW